MWLALESSCDETALALISENGEVQGEWLYSQVQKHAQYGGVVPDLAVGEHLKNFLPLLDLALLEFDLPSIVSRIGVTCGPGLVGCLGMGISFAKSLGLMWDIPVFGVNHLRGHAFSVFMEEITGGEIPWETLLPHLGLLVSGGNTLLFQLSKDLEFQIIAETVDDAAGEALDKGSKLLGIPYPGGAKMEMIAQKGKSSTYRFPQAFPEKKEMKFSFSGLKTSLLYKIKDWTDQEVVEAKSNLCASFQQAVVGQLVRKSGQVLENQEFKTFGLSGGVANNEVLRYEMASLCDQKGVEFLAAPKKYTGDNAAMIGFAAFADSSSLYTNEGQSLSFNPSLRLV